MKTTAEQLEHMRLNLMLLQADITAYLNGEWKHEYYMTVGYNKVYTGRMVWVDVPDG